MNTPRVNDQRHIELTQMGYSEEQARQWIAAQEPEPDPDATQAGGEPTPVWPQNWPALGLFLRLQTQWVRGMDGQPTGLRYEAVEAAINLLGLPDKAQVFDHLVEMEHAALEALND